MSSEFLNIIEFLERDRKIDKEVLIQTIEEAILSASKKTQKLNFIEDDEDVQVHIDRDTGNIEVFAGDKKITPKDFGRIAAQTAKQVIMQKMREAEIAITYDEFKKKQDELVNGIIRRIEGTMVVVEVGKMEAILPKKEQVPKEKYKVHDRIRAFVLDIIKQTSNVKILLSRSHPNFVKKLFEFEVPEIYEGIVEIHAIAREAGDRTKIAVSTTYPNIDCVGSCVGMKGSRVKNIVNELKGEKIDIIRWHEDPSVFIKNALAPAEIRKIEILEENKSCNVIVDDDQLSLAIGKKGQNARLAAKLTGWNIDIHTGSKSAATNIEALFKNDTAVPEENMENKLEETIDILAKKLELEHEIAKALVESGFTSVDQLALAEIEDLTEAEIIDNDIAAKIIESAKNQGGDN